MPRIRPRPINEDLTAKLGIQELFVQEIKNSAYIVWNKDSQICSCPFCGNTDVKIQDLFQKQYWDIIWRSGKPEIIKLEYNFYKYRCGNSASRHIFSKDITFASKNDNITYRLEAEIARRVIIGQSYASIQRDFGILSRQAIGQVFNRWTNRMDDKRRMNDTPRILGIIAGQTEKDAYTLFLDLDKGQIKIIDIIKGVDSLSISGIINNLNIDAIKFVVSNCNPVVVDVINDNLPGATYIIPVEYWLELVTEDYKAFAHSVLKWSPVPDKDTLILEPEENLGFKGNNLKRLFTDRHRIEQPYRDYQELRGIISKRSRAWCFKDLTDWKESICDDMRDALSTTFLQLDSYKEEIYQHELNREIVPSRIAYYTKELEKIINTFRIFSEEVLKAKILYSIPEQDIQRRIPIEELIEHLNDMIYLEDE